MASAHECISADQVRDTLLGTHYNQIFTHSHDLHFILNQDGTLLEINPSGERMLSRPHPEIVGRHFIDFVHPDNHEGFHDRFRRVKAGSVEKFAGALINAHNQPVNCELLALPLTHDGHVCAVFGSARDTTKELATQIAFEDVTSQYQEFYTAHPDPIFTLDAEGRLTEMNAAAETLLGGNATQLLRKKMSDFVTPELRENTQLHFDRAFHGEISRHDTTVSIDGTHFTYVSITAVPQGDPQHPTGLHCVARDIGAELKAHEVLTHMAYTDMRTNLSNRYGLDRDIETSISAQQPFTLFATDLDRFKYVNDSWGREVGDLMIRKVAERMHTHFPSTITVYRYTGDQFFVLARTNEPLEIERLEAELLQLFVEPFDVDGRVIRTTISAGAARYPEDAPDADTIVRNSEHALLAAKRQGRNRVLWWADAHDPDQTERAELALALRGAAARGELTMAYQPQVWLASGRTFGVEALLRWNHPVFGPVAPDRFIPLAEQNGLIVEIGNWVLRKACEDFLGWVAQGLPVPHVTVNISMHQFYDPGFIENVQTVLRDTGLNPSQLVLEVTESVASQHDRVTDRMIEVTRLGVRLALDDFGTGYSSLKSLQEFPLHYLKIDRSFVSELSTGKSEGLTATILTLAHSLGMQAIAEGVETSAQLQRLRMLAADIGQGYYFGKPMPATHIPEWFTTHTPTD